MDFYSPGEGNPRDLLGCTAWERGEGGDEGESSLYSLFLDFGNMHILVVMES